MKRDYPILSDDEAVVNDTEALLSHLEGLAQRHFGLESLRPQQKDVFIALRQHRQVMAMLPTGSGKTLLYALGSLLFRDAITIVICPLIALMRDQRMRMTEAGIESVAIFSDQDDAERRLAYRQLLQGSAKLMFVSPERFCLAGFQRFLRRLKVGMVVVDEAHCVVTWGHSFRPEYSQLAQLLRNMDVQRILALTATASRPSRELIKEMVFPEPVGVFEVIDKPLKDNIAVESIRTYSEDERWLTVKGILRDTASHKSILYFTRREQCQNAAAELRKLGYNSVVYHAGLQREFRKSVEVYLRESDRPVVICATLAFGMGIDLPNVQLIVVVGFPGNIEEMFQMMGRAGRKGEPARAVLVWTGSDPKKRSFQFDKTLPETHDVLERMRYVSSFFPGRHQSALRSKVDIARIFRPLFRSERDLESAVSGLAATLSMLGRGGALDSARSDWVHISLEKTATLTQLMADLPAGPSRRRMVLEWIQQRLPSTGTEGRVHHLCFAFDEIIEDLQISGPKILEVFGFFSAQQKLSFKLIEQAVVRESVLFSGSLEEVHQALPRYQRWRSALSASLQTLSGFVTAEKCRLSQAEKFFLPRMDAGVREGRTACGRCDLCAARGENIIQADLIPIARPLTLSPSQRLR